MLYGSRRLSCRPPLIKVTDKVMIPQDDYPEINFVGLLIGPRGNTLKNLEKEVNSLCSHLNNIILTSESHE